MKNLVEKLSSKFDIDITVAFFFLMMFGAFVAGFGIFLDPVHIAVNIVFSVIGIAIILFAMAGFYESMEL